MLKALFGKLRSASEPEEALEMPATLMRKPKPEEIRQIVDYFPIGKKIRYSPEYKKEVIFDTLVVGYCVDGQFIYSWESIEFDDEGAPTTFLVGPKAKRIDTARIGEFQLLVPDTSDQENTLDYHRRAMIGRGRQFHKGNTIALISNAGALGVSTMDTEVDKKLVLKEGPYAHSEMVLLTPQLDTITVTDQRGAHRAKINVPVVMTIEDRLRGPCVIVDISDVSMRIRVREGHTMPSMNQGDEVTLDIDFGGGEEHLFRLKAAVMRRSTDACVVRIGSYLKDRRFVPFSPLDLLELKANLLNHGK